MVRSFLAINLSVRANEALDRAIVGWRYLGKGVKWVKPGNLHITLKFLGDITRSQIAQIANVLDIITERTGPFNLSLGQPGVFPYPKRPRILWVGLHGDTGPLKKFQGAIEKELAENGFEADLRPFVPHITVGRVKGRPPSMEKISHFLKTQIEAPVSTIEKIHLYQSILTPSGPIYKVLSTHSLDLDSAS